MALLHSVLERTPQVSLNAAQECYNTVGVILALPVFAVVFLSPKCEF